MGGAARIWQILAMLSALSIFSILGGLVLVAGTVITVVGLRHAPEGYEDENGFQLGTQPGVLTPVDFARDGAATQDTGRNPHIEMAA
jgi:hypothetical protein